jgi:hypothetical protein
MSSKPLVIVILHQAESSIKIFWKELHTIVLMVVLMARLGSGTSQH